MNKHQTKHELLSPALSLIIDFSTTVMGQMVRRELDAGRYGTGNVEREHDAGRSTGSAPSLESWTGTQEELVLLRNNNQLNAYSPESGLSGIMGYSEALHSVRYRVRVSVGPQYESLSFS